MQLMASGLARPLQHAPLLALCGASPKTPTSHQLESTACPLTCPTGNPGCLGKPRGPPKGHTSVQQTQTLCQNVHTADTGTLTGEGSSPRLSLWDMPLRLGCGLHTQGRHKPGALTGRTPGAELSPFGHYSWWPSCGGLISCSAEYG